MQTSGNTILITGGGSGIGRALAREFHALGNKVVVAGRREQALDETIAGYPGMAKLRLDIADVGSITALAARAAEEFPKLNVLINNAGVMLPEDLAATEIDLTDAEGTVTTNLLGPIRLTAALLPHLRKQPRPAIVNISSGLAFVPLVRTPTYSATKAAIHSYTVSLRRQLRDAGVEVIELIPPGVQTDLMPGHAADPMMMPLEAFIGEAMRQFQTQPTPKEICVERVVPLRRAEAEGRFETVLGMLNAAPHPAGQ